MPKNQHTDFLAENLAYICQVEEEVDIDIEVDIE